MIFSGNWWDEAVCGFVQQIARRFNANGTRRKTCVHQDAKAGNHVHDASRRFPGRQTGPAGGPGCADYVGAEVYCRTARDGVATAKKILRVS